MSEEIMSQTDIDALIARMQGGGDAASADESSEPGADDTPDATDGAR